MKKESVLIGVSFVACAIAIAFLITMIIENDQKHEKEIDVLYAEHDYVIAQYCVNKLGDSTAYGKVICKTTDGWYGRSDCSIECWKMIPVSVGSIEILTPGPLDW